MRIGPKVPQRFLQMLHAILDGRQQRFQSVAEVFQSADVLVRQYDPHFVELVRHVVELVALSTQRKHSVLLERLS